jgi:HTH-type transcriptional regulator/antitoxin HigA
MVTHDAQGINQIQEIIDFLIDKPIRTDNEREYLHLLGLLVQEYEDKHYPIAETCISNTLVNLMQEHGISASDLSHIFLSEPDFNALLSGDQNINLKQIHELARIFHVSATVFI